MSQEHHCDTIIIGAGLAGITAARTLEKYNRSVRPEDRNRYIVLEAADRIGGRVRTATMQLPDDGRAVTVEDGAMWAHCDIVPGASENPLLRHIKKTSNLERDDMPQEFWKHGQRVNYGGNIQRINAAHQIIEEYHGRDIDLATLFDNNNHLGSNTPSLVSVFGPAETGRQLRQVGVHDMGQLVSRNMGELSYKGLGAFIEHYARYIKPHIKLHTPVARICWNPEGGSVTVQAQNGDVYHAKNCIITVSLGVLKSGIIHFEPPLPERYRENLGHMQMGDFNKVFMLFDSQFELPVNHNTHLDVRTKNDEDIFYLARINGQPLVAAFMGDRLGRICDTDPERATRIAMQGLAEIWGARVCKHIVATRVTQWGKDPWVCGGYSSVDVGHFSARQELSVPIANTLYLAGEAIGATHPETGRNWATHMPGAAISGNRAAKLVLELKAKENPATYRQFISTETGNLRKLA